MARLIFSGDKFHGRIFELTLAKTTVGRGDHNTLALHDASVSQTHCEILVFGDEVIVRDLGSKNGTSVRGVRLHNQQRPLHHGDVVAFGDVEARLELDTASDSDTATDFTAVHEHVRFLRERQQGKPGTPADAALKLGAAPEDSTLDHTAMLSLSPPASPVATPDSAAKVSNHEKSPERIPWAFLVTALILGLTFALWLLFRNR